MIVVTADLLPEVPVIVSLVLCPEAADEDGVNVKVVDPLVAMLAGPNVAVTPAGSPAIENVTAPVKPPVDATAIASVTGTAGVQNMNTHWGGVTVTFVAAGVKVKPPALGPATLKL